MSELARAASWADALAAEGILPADRLYDVQVCLEEALANIVTHGFGATPDPCIRLRLDDRPGRILLEIEDNGAPFDVARFVPPPLPRTIEEAGPGGAGIRLLRALSDAMSYDSADGLNRLSLAFDTRLMPDGSSAPGR